MENKENNFGNLPQIKETPWDIYIGKFITTAQNGSRAYGILKEIDIHNQVAYFQPSIISGPDDLIEINNELPTQMPLPLGVIFPIQGTLENFVEISNKKIFDKKQKQ